MKAHALSAMAVMFVVFPFSSGLALYILPSSLVESATVVPDRTHPLPAPVNRPRQEVGTVGE